MFIHVNIILYILLNKNYKQHEITKILKVNKSTISREIKKGENYDNIYRWEIANRKAMIKRSNSKHQGMKIEKDNYDYGNLNKIKFSKNGKIEKVVENKNLNKKGEIQYKFVCFMY